MRDPMAKTAGLITIFLVAALALPASAATRAVLLMPFGFLDTSGEPRDQGADHDRRLAAARDSLGSQLGAAGPYRLVTSDAAAACPAGDSDCILAAARAAGADLVLTGTVQKVSTMLIQAWIGVFDAADGHRLFFRQINFRGDNDESWRRAAEFLSDELLASPP